MHEITDSILAALAPLLQLNPLIYVAVISIIPIIEVRGAIPVGIAALNLPWWQVLGVSVLAATLPAIPIVLFFKAALNFLHEKKWLPWLTKFLDKKFAGKEQAFGLSKFWGITIFIGIPLPGTGTWTGSGIASLIDMDFWPTVIAALIGNLIAGIIVTAITMLGVTSLPLLIGLTVVGIAVYLIWKFYFKPKKATSSADSATKKESAQE